MMKMITVLLFLLPIFSNAEQYTYPAEGQTKEQQEQDEYSCHQWSVKESGVDPSQPQTTSTTTATDAPTGPTPGSGIRGAVAGGAAGAIIAGIGDNDAGHGAQKGAALGAIGARRKSAHANADQAEQQQASANQQQAQTNGTLDAYYKARAACLEGKGYTVN